jgi:hypothetical protein
VVPDIYRDLEPLKTKVIHSFRTTGTTYPLMEHHIAEDLEPPRIMKL